MRLRGKIKAISLFLLIIIFFCAYGIENASQPGNNKTGNKQRVYKPSKSILVESSNGDVNQVRVLISEGADIESKNSRSQTPIVLAAMNGHIEVVKLLLDKGANIEGSKSAHSNNDFTPLHYAIKQDNIEQINYLLARGANPNLLCPNGSSLDITVEKNNKELTELLIKNNVDVNIKNQSRETPIFRSILEGHKDIVEYLISKGAEVNIKDDHFKAPLHYAALLEESDIAEMLISQGSDINAIDQTGDSALDDAINNIFANHKKIVSLLASKNAKASTAEKIHIASYLGNLTEVQNLISQGIDINITKRNGFTPLHCAVSGGNLEVAKLLIEKGAKINAINSMNCTPLHIAAIRDNKELVKLLIDNGADINARIDTTNSMSRKVPRIDNETPLILAARYGCKNAAELLIDKGLDMDGRYNDDSSAMGMAIKNNNIDFVKMLIAKGADVNYARGRDRWYPLHSAVSTGNKDIVELLIKNGADINVKNSDGESPLYCAIERNECSKEFVEYLISKGADINAKTKNGVTPLYVAARYNHRDIAELLLEKGANPKAGTIPPLFGAGKDVIELLLEKGIDVNSRNSDGETALHIAVQNGNVEAVEFLIQNGADVNAVTKVSRLGNLLSRRSQEKPESVLYQAISRDRKDIVNILKANGAKTDSDSQSLLQGEANPVFRAVKKNDLEELKSLIANGGDINFKDKRDYTLLHHAITNTQSSKDMIVFLLDKGVGINAKTKSGFSVLDFVIAKDNKYLIDFLLERGAAVSSIYSAAYLGDKNKVNEFIKNGVDVNTKELSQNYPLRYAANKEIAELFIANGANVNAVDLENRTPLHYAAEKGDEDFVKLLLAKGANVNAIDSANSTPLFNAIIGGNKNIIKLLIDSGTNIKIGDHGGIPLLSMALLMSDKEIVELLISKGVDINKKDIMGQTPLTWAREASNTEMVELLLKHGAKE